MYTHSYTRSMQMFQANYHTADNSCQMPRAEVKEVPGFQGATEDHTEFMGSFTYIIRFSPMTTLQKRPSKVKKA